MNQGTAVIIGAGPAGLTAALELRLRTGIRPVVIEATDAIGGISRTIRYKGNRMDIGGHRFFSKSERVMRWWQDLMAQRRAKKPQHLAEQQAPDRHDQHNESARAELGHHGHKFI